MSPNSLAVVAPNSQALAERASEELSVSDLVAQVRKVQEVMKSVMRDGEHYGVIPGTPKPTLYKSGSEKLCLVFRLDPEYEIVEQIRDGLHLTITTRCVLFHIPSGQRRGSGMGSCSTRESKYGWRNGARKCPKCGKEAIIKGKDEYGGGWVCFKKKDGCNAKFKDGDAAIEGQSLERVENPDLPDQYNTVLKMSNKRALVAAVLNVTAASDIFTQDLEDLPEGERPAADPRAKPPIERGNISPHLDDNESWRDEPAASTSEHFEARMATLVPLEARIDRCSSYDEMLSIRSELGSKAKPTSALCIEMQKDRETQRCAPEERKLISQTWQRCDRKLAKAEARIKPPSAVDLLTSMPDEDEGQGYIPRGERGTPDPDEDGR